MKTTHDGNPVLKTAALIAALLIGSDVQAENLGAPGANARRNENPAYARYLERLKNRREEALKKRAALNAKKAPAVYRTPTFNPRRASAVESFRARQGPSGGFAHAARRNPLHYHHANQPDIELGIWGWRPHGGYHPPHPIPQFHAAHFRPRYRRVPVDSLPSYIQEKLRRR